MVDRYSHWAAGRGSSMIRYAAGDYVRYSDYADLERQLAEARAERDRFSELYAREAHAHMVSREFAEAERDRLAADNARLREALAKIAGTRMKSRPDADIASAALAGKE